jgi:hypothetical protein
MNSRRACSKTVFAITAAVLLFSGSHQLPAATADFQYGTTITPSVVNPSETISGPGSQVSQAGIGNFDAPTGPIFNGLANGTYGTDITVGTLSVTDFAIGHYVDTYAASITIQLKIKDVVSGQSGIFSFTGVLSGRVANNGTTTGSAFFNPFSDALQTQKIGNSTYDVHIFQTKDFTAPGPPPVGGTGLSGTYSFNVNALSVPEPGALALVALGGLLVALRTTRRKA